MKKTLLAAFSAVLLAACADQEQYEQAVLEEVKKEQQVAEGGKAYQFDEERMTKCVFETTSKHMPGFFALDPDRLMAYRNYSKMLTLSKSKDPKKTMAELQRDFGSPQALSEAHANFADSMMNCYSAMSIETESDSDQ